MKARDDAGPGQSTVEFALTLPVFLLVLVGVLDVTRAIFAYNTLAEAAHEGTRYAIVHGSASESPVGPGSGSYTPPNQDTSVTAQVLRHAFGLDTSRTSVLSTWPDGANNPGQRVHVEVHYSYAPTVGVFMGGASIQMAGVSESTIQY